MQRPIALTAESMLWNRNMESIQIAHTHTYVCVQIEAVSQCVHFHHCILEIKRRYANSTSSSLTNCQSFTIEQEFCVLFICFSSAKSKLSEHEFGTHALCLWTENIPEMLQSDADTVRGVAYAIALCRVHVSPSFSKRKVKGNVDEPGSP